jgi:hypothetical protein
MKMYVILQNRGVEERKKYFLEKVIQVKLVPRDHAQFISARRQGGHGG